MITHVLRLTLGEWYKLRHRWLPWILLAVALLVTQAFLWGLYIVYHTTDGEGTNAFIPDYQYTGETTSIKVTCADLLEERVEEKVAQLSGDERRIVEEEMAQWRPACSGYLSDDEKRYMFTLPSSIGGSISLLFATGLPYLLVMILSASILGTEYGWGTLRPTLTTGAGRWQLLSAKLVLCVLAGAGGLIAIALVNVVSSLLAWIIPADEGASLWLLPEGETWGTGLTYMSELFGKAVYAMTPYVALGVFFVVLTQSTAQAISLSIVFYIVEAMVVPPLLAISERLEDVREVLLSSNVGEWMNLGQAAAAEALEGAVQPDTTQAFFVMLAYIVVLATATFWLFQRRDIGGAKGE